MNQRKMGVILSYLSAGLATVISLLYTPLMLRLLGQSEYGVYNTALAFISYLSLMQFGLNSAFARFYARYQTANDRDGIKRLNGLYMKFYLVISCLSVLAGAVLVRYAHIFLGAKLTPAELEKTRILMRILIVNTALMFPITLFSSNITVNERYIFARLMTILKQVASPLVAIPLLLMGYDSVGIVVATTIITVVIGTCELIYCVKKLHMGISFRRVEKGLLKEILVFTSYIFIGTMVTQINWSLGRIVLASTVGAVAVAIYSVGEQLNQYYISMSTTVSDVFAPKVYRMASRGASDREFTELFTRVGRIQFLIMALISTGFIILGRDFIGKWAGEEYYHSDAYLCAVLLFIANIVHGTQYLGITILQAKNLHKFRSLFYLGLCVVNIGISIPLSKAFGPLGIALATFLIVILGTGVVMNIYYYKKAKLDIPYFWRQIISMCKGLIIPAIAGALIMMFCNTSGWLRMILFGGIYVVIYCASVWFLSMNDYERGLIKRPVNKILAKLHLKQLP